MSWGELVFSSQVVLELKNLPANAGDVRDAGSIPGPGRSPGGGRGNRHQYSCLENPMDRGAWRATVHRVSRSQTRLKQLSMHAYKLLESSKRVEVRKNHWEAHTLRANSQGKRSYSESAEPTNWVEEEVILEKRRIHSSPTPTSSSGASVLRALTHRGSFIISPAKSRWQKPSLIWISLCG